MKDGHAQVFTLGTTIPSGAVMDLASARDIKLLDLADKHRGDEEDQPRLHAGHGAKGTYPKQDKDVQVIGYATHIVAPATCPRTRVYKMTKAMADNVDAMAAVVKAIDGLTPKDMAEDIGVPFHKGAAKFYKEAGRRREDDVSAVAGDAGQRVPRRSHGRPAPCELDGDVRADGAVIALARNPFRPVDLSHAGVTARRRLVAVAMSLYHM